MGIKFKHLISCRLIFRKIRLHHKKKEVTSHTRLPFFFLWRCGPTRTMASSFWRFLDHTQRRITVGRTPLDEWSSSSQRPLPDNTQHSQQINIHAPPVGFEPTISAGERAQTYALGRAATGTGTRLPIQIANWNIYVSSYRHLSDYSTHYPNYRTHSQPGALTNEVVATSDTNNSSSFLLSPISLYGPL